MSEQKPPVQKGLQLSSILSKCKAESDLKSVTVTIDAQTAKMLLDINTTNRPLSKAQVNLYANEMLRGKWKLNGEALIFGVDSNGVSSIISGQHRLHAVIQANNLYNEELHPDAVLQLHTVAITGVQLDTADSVDQGMLRKHGHVLFRDEWVSSVIPKEWNTNNSRKAKWCNALAGAARLVWLRAGGATVSSAPKFIVSEMMEFIKTDHKRLCEFVSAILSAGEEEGAGLKISLPYIAALTYIASLDDNGELHKDTMDTLLDAMLKIAQNDVTPGTAEHALVAYWNQLFSQPGGKDRDLDIVGPFVKALNAIIMGEKTTAAKLKLSKKEAESYADHPPLLAGWDEACFVYAAEQKANQAAAVEQAKAQLLEQREAAKAAREAEKAAKAEQKAKEQAAKEEEKAKARKEAEEAKAKVETGVKPGVMNALAGVVKKQPTAANAEVATKPMIKRKPVPASK